MTCPNANDWSLLAIGVLEDQATDPLLAHLRECPDCRSVYEQDRRFHLERIRMYDQFDRGHDSLRDQLIAALPPTPSGSQADRLVRGRRYIGDFAMSIKYKIGARAALGMISAAACIALVALGMTLVGGRSAFAAAIEQFQKAKTIVCHVSSSAPISVGPLSVKQTGTLYLSGDHGSRFEILANGSTMIVQYAPVKGPMTIVTPLTHQYMVIDSQAAGQIAHTVNKPEDLIRALANLKGQANRELGRMSLDGVDAIGYEIAGQVLGLGFGERSRSELWIDVRTYLPVRYVAEMPGPTGRTCQMVFDHFEWNTPLDPTLFTPDVARDYTRMDATRPAPDEAVMIKGLGHYAELAGKYPPTLDESVVVSDLAISVASRIASHAARDKRAPDQQALAQKAVEIGSGIAYYQQLVREGHSPEYHGKDVSPGQADAVLLRWNLADGQWRVIYGDLRTETIGNQ